jgi:hypothetical protein
MRIYQISPEHWFDRTENVFLFRLRIVCSCGWKTRPFFNPDRGADALFRHQAENGTEVGL